MDYKFIFILFLILIPISSASINTYIIKSSKDALLDEANSATNYGTINTCQIRWSSGGGSDQRCFFNFDLTGLSGTVLNAKLNIYRASYYPTNQPTRWLSLNYINHDKNIVENQVTWNSSSTGVAWDTRGGDYTYLELYGIFGGNVQGWINNTLGENSLNHITSDLGNNISFMLVPDNHLVSNWSGFSTRESAYDPTLVITILENDTYYVRTDKNSYNRCDSVYTYYHAPDWGGYIDIQYDNSGVWETKDFSGIVKGEGTVAFPNSARTSWRNDMNGTFRAMMFDVYSNVILSSQNFTLDHSISCTESTPPPTENGTRDNGTSGSGGNTYINNTYNNGSDNNFTVNSTLIDQLNNTINNENTSWNNSMSNMGNFVSRTILNISSNVDSINNTLANLNQSTSNTFLGAVIQPVTNAIPLKVKAVVTYYLVLLIILIVLGRD